MSTPSSPNHRRAPAKVNLGLHVLRRRSDGFHAIETVLLPVGWHDLLYVAPAATLDFTCSDPRLPHDGSNLCVRAAQILAEWAGIEPQAALHLEKHLPYGAGLGGGSSDAAHTLRLLAPWWGLTPSAEDLQVLAARLGSDVPFFLHDVPMFATGRGEVLHRLDYEFPYTLVVVVPPVHVTTAEAYCLVQPQDGPRPDLRAVVRSNDLERWGRELLNDFEAPLLARHPPIRQAKRILLEGGAGYAALSGSGAAVFGVFDRLDAAQETAGHARHQGWRVWLSRE